jgi:hypothetical protein
MFDPGSGAIYENSSNDPAADQYERRRQQVRGVRANFLKWLPTVSAVSSSAQKSQYRSDCAR